MEINSIPEAFQTKLRLAILSSLLTGQKSFSELKEITSSTDGNLGAQIKKLNELGYVEIEKAFRVEFYSPLLLHNERTIVNKTDLCNTKVRFSNILVLNEGAEI